LIEISVAIIEVRLATDWHGFIHRRCATIRKYSDDAKFWLMILLIERFCGRSRDWPQIQIRDQLRK